MIATLFAPRNWIAPLVSVTTLLALLRLRNVHPAFQGRFTIEDPSTHALALRWEAGEHVARFELDLAPLRAVVTCSAHGTNPGARVLHLAGGRP